jgi:predicted DNA-binding transcriptional regulator AlpA
MMNGNLAEQQLGKANPQNNTELLTAPLINEHEVARLLGMSVATVRRRRLMGHPPKFLKIGSAVRYRQQDILSFVETLPVGGGSK